MKSGEAPSYIYCTLDLHRLRWMPPLYLPMKIYGTPSAHHTKASVGREPLDDRVLYTCQPIIAKSCPPLERPSLAALSGAGGSRWRRVCQPYAERLGAWRNGGRPSWRRHVTLGDNRSLSAKTFTSVDVWAKGSGNQSIIDQGSQTL